MNFSWFKMQVIFFFEKKTTEKIFFLQKCSLNTLWILKIQFLRNRKSYLNRDMYDPTAGILHDIVLSSVGRLVLAELPDTIRHQGIPFEKAAGKSILERGYMISQSKQDIWSVYPVLSFREHGQGKIDEILRKRLADDPEYHFVQKRFASEKIL